MELFTTAKEAFTLSQLRPDDDQLRLRRDVLLAVQVALLGEVSHAVRGIAVSWDNEEITLRAIMHGAPSEADVESMECAGTEIIASFPAHRISVEVVRVDEPAPLEPHNLKAWVFRRKERRDGTTSLIT
jgi:hypothetical protein